VALSAQWGRFLRVYEVARLPVALLLLFLVPYMTPSSRDLSLAITAVMYALVAYGLYFLYSQVGVLHAAHGALWGLGAYTAAILGEGFWLALPLAIIVCVAAAVVIGLPSLRLSGPYFLIITFAFAGFLRLVGNNWLSVTNGRDGLIEREGPTFFGVDFRELEPNYYLVLALLIVSMAVVSLLSRSHFGRRLRAVRENEDLAASLGINVWKERLLAFAWSGIFAGVGGVFYLYYLHHVEPNSFASTAGINLILIVILGGGRSFLGPVIGAYTYIFLPEFLGFSPNTARTVFGALLIAIILLLPLGMAHLPAYVMQWLRQLRNAPANIRKWTQARGAEA
jgi:branched-chain amino acid transport system permease protein